MDENIRKVILDGARAEIARWLEVDRQNQKERGWQHGMDRFRAANIRQAIEDAKRNEVAYKPSAWLGRALSDAERQAFSRELLAMQNDGLIMRISYGGNRTHEIRLLK
jgi:hypothetical protein